MYINLSLNPTSEVGHEAAPHHRRTTEPSRERSEAGGGAELAYVAGWTVLLPISSTVLDTVVATLFRTAVERASCGVHKFLRTGGDPTALFIVLAVADGLFGLCMDLY